MRSEARSRAERPIGAVALMATFTGGEVFAAKIKELSANIRKAATLKVGVMADATYPDGTPVALIAAGNEFGGTFTVPEHEVEIYRSINAEQTEFLKGGRFVKKSKSNFATTHTVPEYTVTRPPRPFMRQCIAEHSGEWPEQIVKFLEKNDYDAAAALKETGELIEAQVKTSIRNFTDPGNAPSTIRRKGFDNPLQETDKMLNSVVHVIED